MCFDDMTKGSNSTPDSVDAVWVVETHAALRYRVASVLGSEGFTVRECPSIAELTRLAPGGPLGCLVLGIDGPDEPRIRDQLHAAGIEAPAVFLATRGDVRTAIRAINAGAIDFFSRSFEDAELIDAVYRALEVGRRRRARRTAGEHLHARMTRLTPRERQVMDHVVAGLPNKLTAVEMGIALGTVKLHRHRVMEKMGVQSVAELVRLLCFCGESEFHPSMAETIGYKEAVEGERRARGLVVTSVDSV